MSAMPKRHGTLYNQVVSLDNLYLAYVQARKGKRKTRSVMLFEKSLGSNLEQLHQELSSETYQPTAYRHFVVHGAKARHIAAPSFRDVVVQHAIYRIVGPIFDRSFSSSSYGCRKGGGAHRASDYLQKALRKAPRGSFILQLDVRKFYYSVDHSILADLIGAKIKDKNLFCLMMLMTKDGDATVGLPIGNLLSQLYALIYLNKMDQWIKRSVKPLFYCRYVDDFIAILPSRQDAVATKARIELWLSTQLNLSLSKWLIIPIKRGCNFVGFRTWKSRRYVRKRSLHRFSKSLKAGNVKSLVSILGHAQATSSELYMVSLLRSKRPDLTLPKKTRKRHDILLHTLPS